MYLLPLGFGIYRVEVNSKFTTWHSQQKEVKTWRKKTILSKEKGGHFLLKLKENCGHKIDDISSSNSIPSGVHDEINVTEAHLQEVK